MFRIPAARSSGKILHLTEGCIAKEGPDEGRTVGLVVGSVDLVGDTLGLAKGTLEGIKVGISDGLLVGDDVGTLDGCSVGPDDGVDVGEELGITVG